MQLFPVLCFSMRYLEMANKIIRPLESCGKLKVVHYPHSTKVIVGTWCSTHVICNLVKNPLVLFINDAKRLYDWENLPFSAIFGPFWGLFNASVTQIGFKRCSVALAVGANLYRCNTFIICNMKKKKISDKRKFYFVINARTNYYREIN